MRLSFRPPCLFPEVASGRDVQYLITKHSKAGPKPCQGGSQKNCETAIGNQCPLRIIEKAAYFCPLFAIHSSAQRQTLLGEPHGNALARAGLSRP
jgi:hypothetical protein